MPAGMDERDELIAELESIIESWIERYAALLLDRAMAELKLERVERLLEIWQSYCLENGHPTWRLMEEVRDILKGKPVLAGTEWL